jgi:hypothetical protein
MNFIDIGLFIAYLAFFIAIASLIMFPILSLVKGNIKNAKASLIGVAVLVVIVLIAYVVSPADQGQFYTKMNTGPGQSKLIGAGLITTYIVGVGLVVITFYSVVIKWFK